MKKKNAFINWIATHKLLAIFVSIAVLITTVAGVMLGIQAGSNNKPAGGSVAATTTTLSPTTTLASTENTTITTTIGEATASTTNTSTSGSDKDASTTGGSNKSTTASTQNTVNTTIQTASPTSAPTTKAPVIVTTITTTKATTMTTAATQPTEWYEAKATADNAHLVAERVIYHINRLRNEDGVQDAIVIPRLCEYSTRRSEQLTVKFEHSITLSRVASTAMQYGRYINPPDYGLDGDPYWETGTREAITMSGIPGTIDKVACDMATAFYNSPKGHWSYVGGAEYTHIGVGVTYKPVIHSEYGPYYYYWHCCVDMADQYILDNYNLLE